MSLYNYGCVCGYIGSHERVCRKVCIGIDVRRQICHCVGRFVYSSVYVSKANIHANIEICIRGPNTVF